MKTLALALTSLLALPAFAKTLVYKGVQNGEPCYLVATLDKDGKILAVEIEGWGREWGVDEGKLDPGPAGVAFDTVHETDDGTVDRLIVAKDWGGNTVIKLHLIPIGSDLSPAAKIIKNTERISFRGDLRQAPAKITHLKAVSSVAFGIEALSVWNIKIACDELTLQK